MTRVRNILLCTTAIVSLATAASAADIPVRKAPPRVAAVAPMVASWSGCYVGGHAGWGWGRKDFTNFVGLTGGLPGTPFDIGDTRVDTDGFLGGVQGGCDYQFQPNWVIGIEGTFSWADINGDTTRTPFEPLGFVEPGSFLRVEAKTESLASVVGRLGYAQGNWMLYGLGGFAWARDKYRASGLFDDGEGVATFDVSGKETRTGFVVGAGLAALLGNNLSGFVEYNFFDFGNRGVDLTGTRDSNFFGPPASTTFRADIDQQIHVVKAGLNWRFGGFGKAPAPVVARY